MRRRRVLRTGQGLRARRDFYRPARPRSTTLRNKPDSAGIATASPIASWTCRADAVRDPQARLQAVYSGGITADGGEEDSGGHTAKWDGCRVVSEAFCLNKGRCSHPRELRFAAICADIAQPEPRIDERCPRGRIGCRPEKQRVPRIASLAPESGPPRVLSSPVAPSACRRPSAHF